MADRLITLTTDFGTRDAYVAAMKGVILNILPTARLVDITHGIAPQDVMEAAFVLREAAPYFPPDAVHLVVVDPGVGTERRPVAVRHGACAYVGPDNGIFPLVIGREQPEHAVVLDRKTVWRTTSPSQTFHGRDIFAPAAAHLASGLALSEMGSSIETLHPLRWAQPIADDEGIQGWVVHVDHFGNCITNISRDTLSTSTAIGPTSDGPDPALPSFKCFVGNSALTEMQKTYGCVAEGEPLLLVGSSGFLEVAVNGGNAAELLDIRKGDAVNIIFQSGSD